MPAIILENISFAYSSKPLLENINLQVGEGERACLIGPNGCGKTTLLRIASQDLLPEQGKVKIVGTNTEFFQVPAIEHYRGSARDYLECALCPLRNIATQFQDATNQISQGDSAVHAEQCYDRLLALMSCFDIWSLEVRLTEVLTRIGLGVLTGSGCDRSLSSMSPGERGRLQLAVTLIMKPEVLILDEPTNHLDARAIDFLVETVNKWRGAVLMSSHDRAFIEDTATVIYDMDVALWNELAKATGSSQVTGLYRCAGAYSKYLAEKTNARRKRRELHAAQQAEKRLLRKHRQEASKIARGGVRLASAEGKAKKFFADRAAATARRRMRNDDKRGEHLSNQEVRRPRSYDLSFELNQPAVSTGIAVAARRATVAGRLAPVSFDLSYGEHLLVTGANGSGKSTLLNWICSGQPPESTQSSGTITGERKVGLVPQQLPQEGDPGFTSPIWENGIGEAGKGVLHPSLWTKPIPELSAGNQRRAQIALALATSPALLIIDEPTNYLDLETMQALEEAMKAWTGTLVVASHDRWLINHWKSRKIYIH
ncbi:ATP-binding cassette domain-containing protein [Varibaculum cambriense]|uniref:ABC transporter, ATP-binding protein n=1 Tax=Varibaculum cambriense TaxID=184870 RepID=A0AB34X320_9ACTO|nr:ATP-binding cassette domain-containing protein [Varibaculum cambriense]KXB81765.1 ABC transporter, ATP-binding protein [Varibaculum cambriense]MBS5944676.1 ABC-F family ATP-binding cassette domain-containing protein [Varibaculum cambriense]MDK8274071.1 ATP-binding cassette domain-containing protein [Varibaculum cambriense]